MKIVTYPDPSLMKESESVPDEEIPSEKTQRLIEEMRQAMLVNNGVGLAAVQVGVPIRLIIYRSRKGDVVPLFNPVIVARSGKYRSRESCLSIPNYSHEIKRAKTVVVEAQDRNLRPIRFKAYSLEAAVLQHEIDHTNGVLFIDHIKSEKTREEILKSFLRKGGESCQ